jgi:hypothetical protein
VLSVPSLPFFKPTELVIFDERREEIAVAATVAILSGRTADTFKPSRNDGL